MGHLLDNVGAQVRVYSPTSPEPAFPPVGDLVSVPSVPIPTRPDYRIALGMPRSIRKDVCAFNPDIIHLSAPDMLGISAQKLARDLGIPTIASVHTHFDTYLDYYKMGWLTAAVRRRLNAFYSDCDFILAPTVAIADELRERAKPAQVGVWARGVDSKLFNPGRRSDAWRLRHGLDEVRPVVVFMGRIVMEKGLAIFADTIRHLEQAGTPVQVLVIGDGPARPWFEKRLPGAVFTGFLSGEALATALASGDVFLNPSCTETFGNVNLEAMASGLPMVCAEAPNTRALMSGGGAILCPPNDPASFSNAVRLLVRDPHLRTRMGRETLALSSAHRWSDVLDAVVTVYRDALGARPLSHGRNLTKQHVPLSEFSASADAEAA